MPPRKGWAAVYCRLSKEDEEKTARESESIRNQRALLLAWAAEHDYRIYRVYTDEDYSGIDRARPGFNAMLADARAGKFEVILAKTQSRFTRDMELVEKYLHGLFPEWGVRFIAVLDHVDTCDPAGKKARQINGLINEWYLEDLSGNVRAVLDHKRHSGCYIASFALYGYRKNPDLTDHMYVYGSDEPKILRLIEQEPALGEKLSQKFGYTLAEVVWAVREEMALTVEDVLARRVRLLFVDAREAMAAAPKVAETMARELGRDQAWIDAQVESFTKMAKNYIFEA